MQTLAEDFGNGERHDFWFGYELGFEHKYLPERDASESIWHGWRLGHIEKEGWHRLSTWQARVKRARQFVGVFRKLIGAFYQGIEFGSYEKDGILRIYVILGEWKSK